MDGFLNTKAFADLLGVGLARAKQILATEEAAGRATRIGPRVFAIPVQRANEIAEERAGYTGPGAKPKRGPSRRECARGGP